MNRVARTILLAAHAAALLGCGSPTPGAPRGPTHAADAAPHSIAQARPHRLPGGAVLLDSASAELDGDARPERVELYVVAERLPDGRVLWEDGHTWMVCVRDDAGSFPLLERFVPWGTVRFWVVAGPGEGARVALQIDSSTGGLRVEEWAFEAGRAAYARRAVLDVPGRVEHRTPGDAFE